MDSRNFTRITTSHKVFVIDEAGKEHNGWMRDVSLGGLFVTGIFIPANAVVDVAIVLSDEVRIDARGHVARSNADGVGIMIDLLEGSESYVHLRRLVLLNTRTEEQTQSVGAEIESKLAMKIIPPT
jgi:hypothetical protein